LATGMMGVLLGLYLHELAIGDRPASFIVGAGLAGAAVAALVVTVFRHRIHRKAALAAVALLAALGAGAATLSNDPTLLCLIAFGGMLNGMGRDRGASLSLEQALLPATTDDQGRTRVFAIYNLLQDIGVAMGSLAAGSPKLIARLSGVDTVVAMRWALIACAGLHLLSALAYLPLSRALAAPERSAVVVSPETRKVLWKLSSLFAI